MIMRSARYAVHSADTQTLESQRGAANLFIYYARVVDSIKEHRKDV
jgi:hypothetical protein